MVYTVSYMKSNRKYNVTGMGSSLLDFVVDTEQELLDELGLDKGTFSPVSLETSRGIMERLKDRTIKVVPGGATANTAAGVRSLGGRSAFMGMVGDDEHGRVYAEGMQNDGVDAHLSKHNQEGTGHAITFVTPDGERTFATHLGAATHFSEDNIDEDKITGSDYVHLEGFQLESPSSKRAIERAVEYAKKSGTKVSIDLSDPGVIDRHREHIEDMLRDSVDVVFVNEDESKALTGLDEEGALEYLGNLTSTAVVKLGERGSLVMHNGEKHTIEPTAVSMENTNGAGDMYAAGFLYGLSQGLDADMAGKLASYAAAQVVASPGARMERDLQGEIKEFLAR